jgi:hypothetical protein
MIKIDNVEYNANWMNDFTRTFEIINGDNSGRLQNTKEMYLEYVGTFFNFEGTLIQTRECTPEEWDRLLMVLANPINDHTVTVPFNQGTMTWKFYISSGAQQLKRVTNGGNRWARSIKVTLTAMGAQWFAGKNIEGMD